MRTRNRTSTTTAAEVGTKELPPPWQPALGDRVGIAVLAGHVGTVQAKHERIRCATTFGVSYVNGVGSWNEEWFRADQLTPVA